MSTANPNPARTLHDYLAAANQTEQAQSNSTVQSVWEATFELPVAPALARRLHSLNALPGRIRSAVTERHPTQLRSVQAQMEQIEIGTMVPMGQPWAGYWQTIGGDSALYVLDMTAGLLDTSDEVALIISDVESLADQVSGLIASLKDADLDDDVKTTVLGYLHQILSYLDEAVVLPTRDLVTIVESAAAGVLGNESLVTKLSKSPVGTAILALLVGLKLFTPLSGMLESKELPSPAPSVVVIMDGKCHSPRELGPGSDEPPALGSSGSPPEASH